MRFAPLLWGCLAQNVPSSPPVTPFKDFIDDMRNVTFDNLAQRNGPWKVAGRAAFDEMRNHILSHYEGVNVTHSYCGEHHFDCITIESQPSLIKARGGHLATPPPIKAELNVTSNSLKAASRLTQCQPGTIPMMRLTLDRVMSHQTLDHFFAKYPGGPAKKSVSDYRLASAGSPHKYAHASQKVDNHGGTSELGLWVPSGDFSLSQQWYVAYKSDGAVQSAECGSLHYPQHGWSEAAIFIYHTNNGYAQGSGCYNLDCAGFVQIDNTFTLGSHWSRYSTKGGQPYEATYGYELHQGNWWFQLEGKNVGYYPVSVYDNGPMATGATSVDYGGETFNDNADAWPQMGSGSFANTGFKNAASHKNIRWYSTDGSAAYPASLTPRAADTSCYTIDYHTGDSKWGTYFYFGGPGGAEDGCKSRTDNDIIV